jgi:SAM-dependent methyltransferase
MKLQTIFEKDILINKNIINILDCGYEINNDNNQKQVNESYSFQWEWVDMMKNRNKAHQYQKEWYLKLYGFKTEKDLARFLRNKQYILDAGCGLGYKAAWFAELCPDSVVIAMDYSNAIYEASKKYSLIKNLFFIHGDIAKTNIKEKSIDYVSCDQVIMHTENPEITFHHLSKLIKNEGGEFSCYVYAKKALPRELLDEYFRSATKDIARQDIILMSEQLTKLGKILSELNIEIDFPDIPLLGIKGGKQDLQRFIYWNFIKCYWNEELGEDISISTNFDWYSPSNAKRYSLRDFKNMVIANQLKIEFLHSEEACHSGRFKKSEK